MNILKQLQIQNCWFYSKEKFNFLVDSCPGFRKGYMISLEKIAQIYATRVETLISLNARERYQNLLLNNPELGFDHIQ
jgi:hypothetical protein